MIDTYGWREGYLSLAGITLMIALPVVFVFLIESPGEVRLKPGDPSSRRQVHPTTERFSASRAQALTSGEFWQLFVVFCLISFSLFGLLPHLVPMLNDRGMTSIDAALVATTVGVTIMVSRVVIGFLIDRIFAPRVALCCFLLSAFSDRSWPVGCRSSWLFSFCRCRSDRPEHRRRARSTRIFDDPLLRLAILW